MVRPPRRPELNARVALAIPCLAEPRLNSDEVLLNCPGSHEDQPDGQRPAHHAPDTDQVEAQLVPLHQTNQLEYQQNGGHRCRRRPEVGADRAEDGEETDQHIVPEPGERVGQGHTENGQVQEVGNRLSDRLGGVVEFGIDTDSGSHLANPLS